MSDQILRSRLIRLAHANPEMRPVLLPLLANTTKRASTGQECDFFLATNGKWYMGLSNIRDDEDDYDDDEDYDPYDGDDFSYYGPFVSFAAAERYLSKHFANPGAYSEDPSGHQPPPKKPIKPSSW